MEVKFTHPDPLVAPWQEGEIITVRVTAVEKDGYTCETIETYPPDMKERHAARIEELMAEHEAELQRHGVMRPSRSEPGSR